AREVARAAAEKITSGSGDLAKRVAGRGLEVKSLAAVTRAHPMPPLTDAATEAAFAAPKGAVVGPFDSGDGLLVLEVIKKDPSTPEEEAAEKATLREQMLQEARVTLYNSAMSRLQRNSSIQVNEGLLRTRTASR
ncbi:MAG TPA: peptidyl-prolyl cis-trans isomerase, partial [Candidatus Saccharimonadales bacterium]|nr:peptidyl-prolyl cis-trans isomerase [Candidatus Saccharimonadales bacterium]